MTGNGYRIDWITDTDVEREIRSAPPPSPELLGSDLMVSIVEFGRDIRQRPAGGVPTPSRYRGPVDINQVFNTRCIIGRLRDIYYALSQLRESGTGALAGRVPIDITAADINAAINAVDYMLTVWWAHHRWCLEGIEGAVQSGLAPPALPSRATKTNGPAMRSSGRSTRDRKRSVYDYDEPTEPLPPLEGGAQAYRQSGYFYRQESMPPMPPPLPEPEVHDPYPPPGGTSMSKFVALFGVICIIVFTIGVYFYHKTSE